MPTSTLTIAGSSISRPTSRLILNNWKISLDSPDELEFTELGVNMPGSFNPEAQVTLSISGQCVFGGNIISRFLGGYTQGVPTVGYRVAGIKLFAYKFPVTASDGTGTMTFNLPSTNVNYQPTESGLSVGQILTQMFAQHSSQLSAIGITTDATTTSQLAALTVVPPDPVYITGNVFWSQVDGLVQQWYGSRYAVVLAYQNTPLGHGIIRIIDTTTLTASTLQLGTDPVYLDSLHEDTSECYTQVIIRGRDNVEPAYLALSNSTLVDPHNASGDNLEATWNINNFMSSGTGTDHGTITSMSSTTLTITSSDPTRTWATNYWSGIQAQVSAINAVGTGIALTEWRRITANTALTAGGSSILTVDIPFANSGYTTYKIFGTPPGISQCYRRLNIPNTWINQHLVSQFNYAVPWAPFQGEVQQTWFPTGVVIGTSGGVPWSFPAQFEVVPYDGTNPGYLLFYQPWVSYFNSQSNLLAGGSAIQQASDIQVVVPYSRGTMTAQYPASGYAGTAYSKYNIQRTLYRDYSTWWDQGSTTAMTTLAQQIHATVSNVIIEGQVSYLGYYAPALTPGSPMALDISMFVGTTSYETMAAPVRGVTYSWPQSGGAENITQLQFSTRRQMFSGDRLYVHSAYSANGPMTGLGNLGRVSVGFMGAVDVTGISPFGAGFSGGGQLTKEAAAAMEGMEGRIGPAQFGGAAMSGDAAMAGLRSQFINPDISVGATFNPGEIRAANQMAAFEEGERRQMEVAERDKAPSRALGRIMGAEGQAAGQVFFPGE